MLNLSQTFNLQILFVTERIVDLRKMVYSIMIFPGLHNAVTCSVNMLECIDSIGHKFLSGFTFQDGTDIQR